MKNDLEYRMKQFLKSRQLDVGSHPNPEEVRLREDLGLDGDDAVEFFNEYRDVFGVDLSNFNFNMHFSSEGGVSPLDLIKAVIPSKALPSKKCIRVKDLIDCAQIGKWYVSM